VLGQHLARLQHAAWVPPARPPAPAAANGDAAGLPTSLTICPSCGASLDVPERMVGGTVHCSECGKPFRVEEGSEVVQVARPARWPLGGRRRARGRLPRWVWVVSGGAVLLLLLLHFLLIAVEPMASPKSRLVPAEGLFDDTSPPKGPAVPPGYWLATLNGLPPEATVFGAIDLTANDPAGSLTLDDAALRTLLPVFVPQKAADQLTPENLGRINFSRVALGYYEGTKGKGGRVIVHLGGVARDGHKRAVEFLRGNAGGKLQVEELDRRLGANGPVCVSSPERPFALKIVDDNNAYLAVCLNGDAPASRAREVVEKLPSSKWVSAGYNPPWFREAIPVGGRGQTDVRGFVLGEIPAAWRRLLTQTLNLRVCPRTFSCRLFRESGEIGLPGGGPPPPRPQPRDLTREGGGMALHLTLNVGGAEAARLLRDDLEKRRPQALDGLLARFPELRKEPQALAQVRQTLDRMRWWADGDTVRTQVQLSGPTWASLLALVKRLSWRPRD
jgi:hypothetical protein